MSDGTVRDDGIGISGADHPITLDDIRRARESLLKQGLSPDEPLIGVLTEAMFDECLASGDIPSTVEVLDRSEGAVTFRLGAEILG